MVLLPTVGKKKETEILAKIYKGFKKYIFILWVFFN